MVIRLSCNVLIILILLTASKAIAQTDLVSKFSVTMISDSAAHNAFTDLIRFKKYFYCAFREAGAHQPGDTADDGTIRIIRSKKGDVWKSVATFKVANYDMRDGKLSITPDGKIMVLMGCSEYIKGRLNKRLTHVSFSSDGLNFAEPQPVSIDKTVRSNFDWIYSVTWVDTTGYAACYQINKPGGKWCVWLLKTYDGIYYEPIISWDVGPRPNEARIRFTPDNRMIIIVRRESGGNGILGISPPPYTDWTWHDLSMKLGGPNFLVLSNDKILIGSRIYSNQEIGQQIGRISEKDRTGIFLANDNGQVRKVLELPSGGDTGYPGMVIYKNYLYVSYYSSHEGKSKVYFAKAKLIDIENEFNN